MSDPTYGDEVDPLIFLAESLRMSGDEASEAAKEDDTLFNVHKSVVESILGSKKPYMMHPIVINTAICGHQEPRYRRGVIGAAGMMPAARHVPHLLKKWIRMVEQGIACHEHVDEFGRELFASQMHDAFYCLLPFIEGNRRTAVLLLQEIRRLVNLPHIIVRSADAYEHDERLEVYRNVFFVPWMKRHAYL